MHPDDRWLTGMVWRDSLFVDAALPFDLRSAPKIFTALADAAEWMVRREGVELIIHYLGDFLLMGRPVTEECTVALETLLGVFHKPGLPVAPDKLEGPTFRLVFLAFELDTVAMEVRLLVPRLRELREVFQQWQDRSCTLKELESLIGKLGHAAQVVQPGKMFLRRMFELKARVGHCRGKIGSMRVSGPTSCGG